MPGSEFYYFRRFKEHSVGYKHADVQFPEANPGGGLTGAFGKLSKK